MADKKISALTASTTPLAGTEVLPIVQSGSTVKVSVDNLTAGRVVDALRVRTTGDVYVGANAAAFAERLRVFGNYMVLDNGTYTGFIGGGSSIGVGGATDLSFRSQGGMAFGINGTTSALAISTAANVTVSTGNLVIGTSGQGIDFSINPNPAGMTSELLNDYDVGTWTPALTSTTGSITSFTASGVYTKVGRLVVVQFIATITNNGTGAGAIDVAGLPFTSSSFSAGCGRENVVTGNMLLLNMANSATTARLTTFNNLYPGATSAAFTVTMSYVTAS